ncbi:hypothetical protein Q75_02380 [Bacillus coahuilensis p1.1.43]|uniref:Uncharacterized protein n=1 Tax=Bacillus coahuilensis p1.1.43 TaxID=1150625 RepID=A0A147KBE7_9BACI|nr:hypothetical protein [Bacillus coahuilensis]KUP08489.1 hypothetical protein Q75_02380 [Bacillus coahuilensis p1.1.43]
MIQIQNTSHFAGIRIIGDVHSFRTLEEAIHKIVGEEGEYPIYESARLRALDFTKEFQSSCTGDREIVWIDHGLASEVVRSNQIAQQENVYIGFQSLWPEALFFTMVMNDFIKLYRKKSQASGYRYSGFNHKAISIRGLFMHGGDVVKANLHENHQYDSQK